MEYDEDDYLLLSGIQHFAFCRRQWALIHIEQQWAENYRTTSGNIMHKNAHQDNRFERHGDMIIAKGLRIASRKLGVSGQCDIVEFEEANNGITLNQYNSTWRIIPVEYKRGQPKEGNEDELQLCLQAICLEEMFLTKIEEGYLYYGEKHQRVKVQFNYELRQCVESYISEMHSLMKKGYTPTVKTTKKCQACSLKNICLPKLQKTENVSQYIYRHIGEEGE